MSLNPKKLALLCTQAACVFLLAPPAFAADFNRVIALNNAGVKALDHGDWQLSIDKLREALTLDPSYTLARNNLATAHGQYGLKLRRTPKKALDQFHMSFLLNTNDVNTIQLMRGVIRLMGKNPDDYKVRESLAEEAMRAGDYAGAAAEYSESLRLKDSDETRKKYQEACARVEKFYHLDSDAGSATQTNWSSYMDDAQRKIKRAWFPPLSNIPYAITLIFKVEQTGLVRNVRIDETSGRGDADEAAISAVKHASPLSPLPDAVREPVEVRFTLTYNVSRTAGGTAGGPKFAPLPTGRPSAYGYDPIVLPVAKISSLPMANQSDLLKAENYALAYETNGEIAEAMELYNRILAARRRMHNEGDGQTERNLQRMKLWQQADALWNKEKWAQASRVYGQILDSIQNSTMPLPTKLALVEHLRPFLTGEHMDKTLFVRERQLSLKLRRDIDQLVRTEDLNREALGYETAKQYDMAEKKYREALAIKIRVLGPTSGETLDQYAKIAGLYKDQGKVADATALYEKTAAVYRTVANRDSQFVNMLESYADMLAHVHHDAKAKAIYDEARRFYSGK